MDADMMASEYETEASIDALLVELGWEDVPVRDLPEDAMPTGWDD